MSNKNAEVTLSGAAEDVLHALFFRGALPSGDLPSKAGAAELRELSLAETRTTEVRYHGEDYFTWLTPEGQRAAIERVVKDSSCKCCYELKLGIERNIESIIHQAEANNTATAELAQEVDSKIRGNSAFSKLSCTVFPSTPKPEDTLHQALVAALPSMQSDKMKGCAESIAEAINAAYAKLKEPASGSAGYEESISYNAGFFCAPSESKITVRGAVRVTPPGITAEFQDVINKGTRELLKRELEPGGLLFKK